ncbi:hypothetical protein C8R47DRAFT_1104735 [Mycena vitilis]|nr:hypothetical protein C8R47DRAFT_1104735 [Mycena vitilis]
MSSSSPSSCGGGAPNMPGIFIPMNPAGPSAPAPHIGHSPSSPSSSNISPSTCTSMSPSPSAPSPNMNGGIGMSPKGLNPRCCCCLRPAYQMTPAGSRSNRQVGQVVCPGRANQGPRHAAWKTCAQGSAMMPSAGGDAGSLVSESVAGVGSAGGVESLSSLLAGAAAAGAGAGVGAANSAPSPSNKRSQQMAQPLSPPTAPTSSGPGALPAWSALTRSRRRTSPSGTRSSPARMRAAFSGESFGGGGGWPKTKSPFAASPRVRKVKSWAMGVGAVGPPWPWRRNAPFGSGLGLRLGARGGGSLVCAGGGGTRWDGWRRSRSRSWSLSSFLRRRRPLEGCMGSSGGIASSSSTSVQALSPSSSATS